MSNIIWITLLIICIMANSIMLSLEGNHSKPLNALAIIICAVALALRIGHGG